MKKLVYWLLPLMVMLLTGCQPKYENVAVAFANLQFNGKSEEAMQYLTEDSKAIYDGLGGLLLSLMTREDGQFQAKVVSHELNGEKAVVTIVDANNPESEEISIPLQKVEGKWLVDLMATEEDFEKLNEEQQNSTETVNEETTEEVSDAVNELDEKTKAQIEAAKETLKETSDAVQQDVKEVKEGTLKAQKEAQKALKEATKELEKVNN